MIQTREQAIAALSPHLVSDACEAMRKQMRADEEDGYNARANRLRIAIEALAALLDSKPEPRTYRETLNADRAHAFRGEL